MGARGPKPGTMKARPRDGNGRWLPIVTPLKSWPQEAVLASIEKNFGLRSQVARDLGCNVMTVYRYAEEFEEVRKAFWAQDERVNDMAELSLVAAIQKGEAWAVCFRLKTKAKDRGYIERFEASGPGGGPVEHKVLSLQITPTMLSEALAALSAAGALADGSGDGVPG